MHKSRVLYTCYKCCSWFEDYETLLGHLYWRHGTESEQCSKCPLRMWHMAAHKCNVLPQQLNSGKENSSYSSSTSSESYSGCSTSESSDIEDSDSSDSESDTEMADQQNYVKETPWCYCGKEIEGADMIGCDAPKCVYQWYHFACVGVVILPKGDWFCPSCRANPST